MPGMPRVPGFNDAIKMMQTQTEVLAELPSTIAELQRAVRGLGETLNASRGVRRRRAGLVRRVEPHTRSLSESSPRRRRELTVPRGSSSSSAISPGV